jgi:hypothetical protein
MQADISRLAWALVLGSGLLLAPAARALPPDRVVLLEPGQGRFERLPPGGWTATSLDPKVVEAQAFETEELHLMPVGEGVGLVLLACPAIQGLQLWRVRVGGSPEAHRPDPVGLAGPCGCGQEGTWPLRCKVRDATCLEALRTWLSEAEIGADELVLELEVAAVQALLRDLARRVERAGFRDIRLAFAAGNLRLEGELADRASWRGLVVALYEGMVGRLVLDDRLGLRSQAGQEAR